MSIFDNLIGQKSIQAELESAINQVDSHSAANELQKSWLFIGPAGSGRSNAALCFAAGLECTNTQINGCGECEQCHAVQNYSHPDLIHIQPKGRTISVQNARDMIQKAVRQPIFGKWLVVIIEDADRMTEAAANILLKIIEEPPQRTFFLLCCLSDTPRDIPLTIKSRCRKLQLRLPQKLELADYLVRTYGVENKKALWAASVSNSHVGRAKRLLFDQSARDMREMSFDIINKSQSSSQRYIYANTLIKAYENLVNDEVKSEHVALEKKWEDLKIKKSINQSEYNQKARKSRLLLDLIDINLQDLAWLFRDSILLSALNLPRLHNPDNSGYLNKYREKLVQIDAFDQSFELAERFSQAALIGCIEAIIQCREYIFNNVKPIYAFENLLVKIGNHLSC